MELDIFWNYDKIITVIIIIGKEEVNETPVTRYQSTD